jgi:hypothetical protein
MYKGSVNIILHTVVIHFTKFNKYHPVTTRRDSSVGIATGWEAGVYFMAGTYFFSLLHSVQTGSELEDISSGVRRLGREPDHSPPSTAEFKNVGAIPPLPHKFSCRDA